MKRRLSQAGGFTLLELLMVVIIIAILAALALPGYFRAVEKSRSSEATIALGQLRGATQRYCVEQNGTYPTAFTDLDVENPNNLPNRQYNYALPAGGCPNPGAGTPLTITEVATRNGGPCVNSTVTLNDPPPIVGGSMFSFVWTGPCL